MKISLQIILAAFFLASGGTKETSRGECTPAFFELERSLRIQTGASELSFDMIAVGCLENLDGTWPPPHDLLEQRLSTELQEPHPVQILLLIRDRSPALRSRLAAAINGLLQDVVVYDVFIFNAKASE